MSVRTLLNAGGALLVAGTLPAVGTLAANAAASEPFRIEKFIVQTTQAQVEQLGGSSYKIENVPYTFTQAGGHPSALTTTIAFASEKAEGEALAPTRDPKDVVVDLPPGLLGDPQALARCPLAWVVNKSKHCPAQTQVGVYRVREGKGNNIQELLGPIVNVTPEAGQSAEFAFENTAEFNPVLAAHLVRTAQGYGVSVTSNDIPPIGLDEVETTFWGVPADKSHDSLRGQFCSAFEYAPQSLSCSGTGQSSGETPVPFLIWPTDCTAGQQVVTVRADSWEEPGRHVEETLPFPSETSGVTGCELVQFLGGTGIGAKPDTLQADAPVGLHINLAIPQTETPGTLQAPQLRETKVTLPAGMSVSPGIVDGIQACEKEGREGINIEGPESEEVAPNGELRLAPGHCPDASTVGTAEAITPLLGVPVRGHVYLARPGCGGAGQHPCTVQDALDGNLYRLYLELGGTGEFANAGIQFKVPFDVEVNPATGQLTSVVKGIMQAPVSEVHVHLNGGPRASLANPAACGAASTVADLTPWSAPGKIVAGPSEGMLVAGTPDATLSSSFPVEGCASPVPFAPGFVVGTVTPNAGKFSSFTLNISRKDREQYIKGVQVHTPPGLLGVLASVPLCGEAQANAGTCPEASEIGTTRVASGAGSHPFEIEGNVYLTGPYGGSPFGLSVATPAVAGPFNLGMVVVRARIDVNKADSTLTITTDESGPHAIPQIWMGVPLRLQRITVNVTRPGFMFNPTNCKAQRIAASISGNQQAVTSVSSPFAVGNCRSLAFKPTFKVSTSGKTSRKKGASLDARLTFPKNAMGEDANVAYVKVSLPRQLPSRLTTLQKACPAATFNTNPAACPKGSIVGIAKASTLLLPALPKSRLCPGKSACPSVAGPVYFVSHGGEQFPQLIVVLQGDGVRVDLAGNTFISKAGITSSTFRTVPDVPVSSFELYLPQGANSALAANANLCKVKGGLKMPTEFVAQNGAVIKPLTKIAVSGCGNGKAKGARARKARHGRGRR